MGHGDTLGALQLAGAGVGAVAESKFVHLGDHSLGSALCLGTALRKQGKGTDARSHEEHRRAVLAGSNAGAAAHASRCIHTLLCLVVRDKDVVGVLGGAGADGDETAGLQNLVEGGTVHDKVLDHGEGGASPRLYSDGSAVLEVAHKELAGGHVVVRTVGTAVDVE